MTKRRRTTTVPEQTTSLATLNLQVTQANQPTRSPEMIDTLVEVQPTAESPQSILLEQIMMTLRSIEERTKLIEMILRTQSVSSTPSSHTGGALNLGDTLCAHMGQAGSSFRGTLRKRTIECMQGMDGGLYFPDLYTKLRVGLEKAVERQTNCSSREWGNVLESHVGVQGRIKDFLKDKRTKIGIVAVSKFEKIFCSPPTGDISDWASVSELTEQWTEQVRSSQGINADSIHLLACARAHVDKMLHQNHDITLWRSRTESKVASDRNVTVEELRSSNQVSTEDFLYLAFVVRLQELR